MKHVQSLIPFVVAAASFLGMVHAQDSWTPLTVSGVTVSQNHDTQVVTIGYDLTNNGASAFIQLDVLTNGVSIGADHLKSLSGAVSKSMSQFVPDGTGRRITWDARRDWPEHLAKDATIRILAYYTNHLDQVPGVYMVVDLSDGTNVSSYPVSYTLTAPDPSNDVTCCSNKLWLKRIEPGTFFEADTRNVTLTNHFFIGVFELTQRQWELVMGTKPSGFMFGYAMRPVEQVSYDAIRGSTNAIDNIDWPATGYAVSTNSFMGVLRAKTGLAFDLPTEAQWEYACRAGTTNVYNNGSDDTNTLVDLAWYASNSSGQTHIAGTRTANAWGLYDMHGNVFEWCLDWYKGLPVSAATEPVGPESGLDRVLRGGSWNVSARYCRSGSRGEGNSFIKYNSNGFRPALVVRP